MNVELQAACSSIGYLEKGTYYKEPDCLETIKDIIRFLKREDESCDVRRQIGDSQIVQNDLLPIVKQYKDDRILLETTLRLLVNLTQPAVLCFQNQVPGDKTNRNYFLQIESHLQFYKQSFSDEALLAVLTHKLGELLQLDWENRQEEDRLLIERILILLRNVLHIPPNPAAEGRTDDDASIHDQFLWALHVSGMEDLLLYLGSSEDERQFAFHVLEVISLMCREQTAEQLAAAGGSRALSERLQDQKELEVAREKEKSAKAAKVFKYSSRHSRFGGTYTLANVKSISDNQLISHRSLAQIKDMNFDHNKVPKKVGKNRKPVTETEITRRSTLSIRVFLKEFCVQFLENCYNPLMRAVKDILVRSHGQENDETYYLWALRFFMEFNRRLNKEIRVDLVGETMSVQSFHYVQTNLQTYHEMIFSNKKDGKIWSRRMHLALKAYQELLQTMNAMTSSKDPKLRENADILKGNVFYMMEYRDILLLLLKKFNESLQSRAFLRDLVETSHLFIKMLEHYCKKHGHLVVQKRKKKAKKRRNRPAANVATEANVTDQELEDLWDSVSGDLSAIFQNRQRVPESEAPFDAASQVEVDLQRAEAMLRIQTALRDNRAGEAVALFRAAREVWPDQEQFGAVDISPEEEFMALREVFYANIPRPDVVEDVEEYVSSDNEEEEDEVQYESMEQEFNFQAFIKRLAQPTIIKAYSVLLRDYANNTSYTNHCIIKMLHRIAFDCCMVALLYQTSLFRVFEKIMFDPACRTSHLQELATFAKHVVRKFFETASKNPKAFVEMFFWKTPKEAIEIVEGYGTQNVQVKQHWSEQLDMELERLYEEFKDKQEEGMDVVDHIMVHISDQSKTRRQILKQLKWLNIIESAKEVKPQKNSLKRNWQEEEVLQLSQLFEEFKDSDDPVNNIMNGLNVPRSRNKVLDKLLEMGLIQDKKEMRKKRRGGKKKKGGDGRPEDSDQDESAEHHTGQHMEASEDENSDENSSAARHSDEGSSVASSSSSEEDNGDPLYVVQIRKTAKRCSKEGHQEAVKWLSNCIMRCAEDREEDDDDQPIPIVPLTEEQETAMEDKHFLKLLKHCKICAPANEQERFWRIPGHLKAPSLRSIGNAVVSFNETKQTKEKTKNREKLHALQNLVQERGTSKRKTIEEMYSKSDEVTSPAAGSAKKSRLKRTFSENSSDSSDDDMPLAEVSQHAKRQRVVTSSDDEEMDKENNQSFTNPDNQSIVENIERESETTVDSTTTPTNVLSAENISTFPATILSQSFSDDDSDVDDHIPFKQLLSKNQKKKAARIMSDSEDE